jgi:hypothetical protein
MHNYVEIILAWSNSGRTGLPGVELEMGNAAYRRLKA